MWQFLCKKFDRCVEQSKIPTIENVAIGQYSYGENL